MVENSSVLQTHIRFFYSQKASLEALKQQKNLGQETVNNYQTQITVLNDLIWKYTNDTDPIRIDGLPHLDMSLININTDLANLEVIKQNKNL